MAARLTRARKRLGAAEFRVPVGSELAERVAVVADVAYLAFTTGYAPGSGPDLLRADVAAEAIRLVRVLARSSRAPSAELDALLALMLLQHSRRDARVAPTAPGAAARPGPLPLAPRRDRGGAGLLDPARHGPGAPYLLQALIAAEHAVAPRAADTDLARIVSRYDELLALTDSPVVRLNRAVAVAEADGPVAGLAALAESTCPATGCPPCGPSCSPGPAPRRGLGAALRRRASRAAPTRPSGPTSPARRRGSASGDRGDDRDLGAVRRRGGQVVEEADVVVADVHVDEPAQLAVVVEDPAP